MNCCVIVSLRISFQIVGFLYEKNYFFFLFQDFVFGLFYLFICFLLKGITQIQNLIFSSIIPEKYRNNSCFLSKLFGILPFSLFFFSWKTLKITNGKKTKRKRKKKTSRKSIVKKHKKNSKGIVLLSFFNSFLFFVFHSSKIWGKIMDKIREKSQKWKVFKRKCIWTKLFYNYYKVCFVFVFNIIIGQH